MSQPWLQGFTCTEIKIWTRKLPMYLGFSGFLIFFFAFPFYPFLIFFCGSDWPSIGLASSLKISENFYHGVAKCSRRKFCSTFFTQISEHYRAYLALHLITLIWVSLERTAPTAKLKYGWCHRLVKGDDIRSGTNTNACHGRLQAAWKSLG